MSQMHASNIAYWLFHARLDASDVRVLTDIESGQPPHLEDRFSIAYLIAIECVDYDEEHNTLAINTKGREALEFYSSP